MTPALRSHLARLGPNGERWVRALPAVLDRVVDSWGFVAGQPISVGPWSVVLEGVRDGERVVAKVAVPSEHLEQQARVLRVADGRGYARLLESDLDLGVLLLEALGPSLEDELVAAYGHLPAPHVPHGYLTAMARPMVESLTRAWELPLAVAEEVSPDTNKAARLGVLIEELAHRHRVDEHRPAIERALLYAGQRKELCDPQRHVVCHGDPHPGNLLAVESPRPGAESGHVWVDPDGFRCEKEYDLGVVLRDANRLVLGWEDPVVTLRQWCAQLAAMADADAEAIWQWAFVERVASGLSLIDHRRADEGRPFLEAATHLMSFRAGAA